jgi:hypothetical protein
MTALLGSVTVPLMVPKVWAEASNPTKNTMSSKRAEKSKAPRKEPGITPP